MAFRREYFRSKSLAKAYKPTDGTVHSVAKACGHYIVYVELFR